jgi:hypothetical protein
LHPHILWHRLLRQNLSGLNRPEQCKLLITCSEVVHNYDLKNLDSEYATVYICGEEIPQKRY